MNESESINESIFSYILTTSKISSSFLGPCRCSHSSAGMIFGGPTQLLTVDLPTMFSSSGEGSHEEIAVVYDLSRLTSGHFEDIEGIIGTPRADLDDHKRTS
jgi:hypothetical protein